MAKFIFVTDPKDPKKLMGARHIARDDGRFRMLCMQNIPGRLGAAIRGKLGMFDPQQVRAHDVCIGCRWHFERLPVEERTSHAVTSSG